MGHQEVDISRMSVAERLELAELLWTSIAQTPEAVPMTAAQQAELDRRLDDAERDGGGGIVIACFHAKRDPLVWQSRR